MNIAYQVVGDGPFDLVHVPPFVSNLELQWEHPDERRYFERLASFSRLIMFDKRGTGLSDRVAVATLEERMDDLRAVMDAAGSQRAVVFGSSEGGALSILFAATYPEHVSALDSQLLDLIQCVSHDGSSRHGCASAKEGFIRLVAEHLAQVGDSRIDVGEGRAGIRPIAESHDCGRLFVSAEPVKDNGDQRQRSGDKQVTA